MWARLRNRLQFFVRRDRFNRELAEEMEFHRRLLERDRIREGFSTGAAARCARIQLGNTAAASDAAREAWMFGWFETLVADLRYALRSMRRSPGFSAVATLSLALGIGANSAIFTLINAVMLKSLPVSHPEELVMLAQQGGPQNRSVAFGPALWQRIQAEQDVFSSVEVYGATGTGDLGINDGRRPTIGLVSGGFFSTLGIRPARGRLLVDPDDHPGCPAIAVITDAFWRGALGARADVLDQPLPVNGRPFQIVGVTPPGFFGIEYGQYVPVWVPQCAAQLVSAGSNPGGGWVIGRLRPGMSLAQSRARMTALAPRIFDGTANQLQTTGAGPRTIDVVPFAKGLPFLSERYGSALSMLMGTVGVVLLLACANIANLLLARANARRREIGLRLALGASRLRIVRQLLTESLLLALIGAAASVLVAYWGSRTLVAMLSDAIVLDLTPDLRVLAFTTAVATVTGVLFGLVPARRAVGRRSGVDIAPRVDGGRGVAEGHSRFGPGQALVAAQIALSVVMVVIAVLLVGSWQRLLAIETGFEPRGVMLATVGAASSGLRPDQQAETFRTVLDRLRAMRGAGSAAAVWIMPLSGNARTIINAEGFTALPAVDFEARLNRVSDGYFQTVGTPLAGRDFGPAETPQSPRVVIVNEEFARRVYGRTDVVGARFRVRQRTRLSGPIEIIGVAGNTTWGRLREERQPIVYEAVSQVAEPGRVMSFAVRTDGDVQALGPGIRAAAAAVHPRLDVAMSTLEERIGDSVRLPRTLAALSGFFGGLALLLAMVGLYGIMAYTVGRRRNEIGVRIALGAARMRIVAMVLGETGRLVLVGIVIGVGLSLAAARLVSTFLYGTAPNDPATLAVSALILALVSIGAALLPARRAARMNPVAALRED